MKDACRLIDYLLTEVDRQTNIVKPKELCPADDAYHLPDNQEFAKNNSTSLVVGNMQGKKGK